MADAVEDRLRELYAIEQIHKRLKPGDTLYEEAQDRLEEAEDRFGKALSAGYNPSLLFQVLMRWIAASSWRRSPSTTG